jgi:hypothetical protein
VIVWSWNSIVSAVTRLYLECLGWYLSSPNHVHQHWCGYWGCFPIANLARISSWPLASIKSQAEEWVDIYLLFPKCLCGIDRHIFDTSTGKHVLVQSDVRRCQNLFLPFICVCLYTHTHRVRLGFYVPWIFFFWAHFYQSWQIFCKNSLIITGISLFLLPNSTIMCSWWTYIGLLLS